MSRFHWFGFIVNEAGEPIENAEISIFLAGSDVPAYVYYNEFSEDFSNVLPQMTTLNNGYYEFWIGDYTEPHGYSSTQKFKIKWERIGVSSGEIDYVNIFPLTQGFFPVDETDESSIIKDKVVSNNLAFQWTTHKNWNVLNDGEGVHGLEFLDINSVDTNYNKLVSNLDGYKWDKHILSEVNSYDSLVGKPHGIEPIDIYNADPEINKVVSNKLIYDILLNHNNLSLHSDQRDDQLQALIDALTSTVSGIKSDIFEVLIIDWVNNFDGSYEYIINHNFVVMYPTVICWNHATNKVEKMADIELIDVNNIKLTIYGSPIRLDVRITN